MCVYLLKMTLMRWKVVFNQLVSQSEKQISIRLSVVCLFAHTVSQSVRRLVSQTDSQSFWKLVM